jgi:hypothetical protein
MGHWPKSTVNSVTLTADSIGYTVQVID